MTFEELEFSISQYLDGTLSAEETVVLEARLAEDVDARRLLEEYRTLDDALKSPPLPELAWDKLASHISRAVAEDAEQFEFNISQYVDGTLGADEIAAVKGRLETAPAGRRLVVEHRRVNELLRSPPELAAVRWARLASHLSDVVAESMEPRTIKLFARPWVRAMSGLAMAACMTLATGVGIRSYLHRGSGGGSRQPIEVEIADGGLNPAALKAVISVQISGPEPAAGTAVAEVSIGAGPDGPVYSGAAYAKGIMTRSPRSFIATNAPAVQDALAQDANSMPY